MTPSCGCLPCSVLLLLFFLSPPASSATLEGKVVDPEGQPVPGAQVWGIQDLIDHDQASGQQRTISRQGVTGPDGGFILDDFQDDTSLVAYACAEGYALGEVLLAGPLQHSVQIALRPAVRLSGRVRDPEGKPVAAAEVSATRTMYASPYPLAPGEVTCGRISTLSDEEGAFRLGPLPAEHWVLEAKGEVWLTVRQEQLPRSWNESLDGIELVLARAAEAAGYVFDPEGKPVAGAYVTAQRLSEHATTGEDGKYRLNGLPQGEQRLRVDHRSYENGSLALTIQPGENRADLTLGHKRVEVHGRVTDVEGEPLAGAFVDIRTPTESPLCGQGSETREDGSFTVWMRPGASCVLKARKNGYFFVGPPIPVDKDAKSIEIRLHRGTSVHGRILGLSPQDLARVHVEGGFGDVGSCVVRNGGRADGRVEADGSYRIDGLSSFTPEGIRVRAWTPGSAGRMVYCEVPVKPGQKEAMVDIEFPPTYRVRGRVLDQDGRPLEGADVRLSGKPGSFSTQSRRDGSFSLEAESGTYEVGISRQGHTLDEKPEVTVSGAPVEGLEVRMIPGGEIRGRVPGFEPEGSVWVSAEGPAEVGGRLELDGSFRFTELAPGDWKVTVHRSSGAEDRQGEGRVRVPYGAEAHLDVELRMGPLTLSGLLLENGKPVHKNIELRSPEAPGFSYSLSTPLGTFRFEKLRAGRYLLRVNDSAGGEPREQAVELSSDRELVIDLKNL